ncbi:MAG: zinc-ribbon domain-containing protein [Fervidobacterium sp.]|uniref:zinc-ribbon domain-containing protein n=1 Tax=Fervidobacterium sp. TaxID=1871331 RepID=UPI00404B21DC
MLNVAILSRRGTGVKQERNDETILNCDWNFHKKKCPRCGKLVPDDAKTCYACGWYFYWSSEIGEDDYAYDDDEYY